MIGALGRRFDDVRLMEKVAKSDSTGCWNWTASLSRTGYGCFRYQGRSQQAHRVAYLIFVGSLTSAQVVDHLCRNRRCVNPDHLEAVSQRENLLRGETVTARNAAATSCAKGHEFTPGNTYIDPMNGARKCRTCRRVNRRAHYLRTAQ